MRWFYRHHTSMVWRYFKQKTAYLFFHAIVLYYKMIMRIHHNCYITIRCTNWRNYFKMFLYARKDVLSFLLLKIIRFHNPIFDKNTAFILWMISRKVWQGCINIIVKSCSSSHRSTIIISWMMWSIHQCDLGYSLNVRLWYVIHVITYLISYKQENLK